MVADIALTKLIREITKISQSLFAALGIVVGASDDVWAGRSSSCYSARRSAIFLKNSDFIGDWSIFWFHLQWN